MAITTRFVLRERWIEVVAVTSSELGYARGDARGSSGLVG